MAPTEVTQAQELVRAIVQAANHTAATHTNTLSEKESGTAKLAELRTETVRETARDAGMPRMSEAARWGDMIHVSAPPHVMSAVGSLSRMPRQESLVPVSMPREERQAPSTALRGISIGRSSRNGSSTAIDIGSSRSPAQRLPDDYDRVVQDRGHTTQMSQATTRGHSGGINLSTLFSRQSRADGSQTARY